MAGLVAQRFSTLAATSRFLRIVGHDKCCGGTEQCYRNDHLTVSLLENGSLPEN